MTGISTPGPRNRQDDIADHLEDNPSLKTQLDTIMLSAYRRAARQAAVETGFAESLFPSTCPWSFAQITAPEFWPTGI